MMGWYAWKLLPGATKWICIGSVLESEIEHRLNRIPAPLCLDDVIDLQIWLNEWLGEEKLR
jgi:hypothetical protein